VSSANGVRIALFTFFGTALFLPRTYTMTLYVLLGMAAAARQLFLRQPEAVGSTAAAAT
jgi:hypothetical protein